MADVPHYDVDFYSDDFIRDPLPRYAEMRALGRLVYLPQIDSYALTRFAEVRAALRDAATFCSGMGVAGDRFGCDFLQGNVVASDEPRHSELRRAMAPPLLPGALEAIRPSVQTAADTLIETLVDLEDFDVMADLARHLPLKIVRDMVGLPDLGQENMLKWAAAAFDVLGRQNRRGREAVATIREMRTFIERDATREALKPDSWTRRIHDLVDRGQLSADLAPYAIRDYINPSLDTTIATTGELIWQIAANPDRWQDIKHDPDLCVNAVNEAVRLGAPIRSFSRHTSCDVDIAGHHIPAGARIMMLFGSANRDPDAFPDPDRFDLQRDPHRHVGFGSGIHMCIGMHLAELEMTCLLRAMIPRVGTVRVDRPVIAMNNTIRAFASLRGRFEREERCFAVELSASPARDGQSLLRAKVIRRDRVATGIVAFVLEPDTGSVFPAAAPGAHIDVHIAPGLVRQYSLTGPMDDGCYRIAVLLDPDSRGGSRALHERVPVGEVVLIGRPRNNFPLHDHPGTSLLFAGGVGLTPLLAMAWRLYREHRPFALHVSVRSRDRLAFAGELAASPFAERVHVHVDDESDGRSLDIAREVQVAGPDSRIYLCGPRGFMDHVASRAMAAGMPDSRIHIEHFGAEIDLHGDPFEVFAARSGLSVEVGPDESILTALQRSGLSVATSCENGVCGTCLTPVLAGVPDHRDMVLTDSEKAGNSRIAVCCSRSRSRRLVLDL